MAAGTFRGRIWRGAPGPTPAPLRWPRGPAAAAPGVGTLAGLGRLPGAPHPVPGGTAGSSPGRGADQEGSAAQARPSPLNPAPLVPGGALRDPPCAALREDLQDQILCEMSNSVAVPWFSIALWPEQHSELPVSWGISRVRAGGGNNSFPEGKRALPGINIPSAAGIIPNPQ